MPGLEVAEQLGSMVIHPVSKNDLQGFAGNGGKVRRPEVDSAPPANEQEPRTLNLEAAETEIADENEANQAVDWLRTNILTNFPSVLAIQGNLDPLRVASLLEA